MKEITILETQNINAGYMMDLSGIATLRNVATVNATQMLTAGSSAMVGYYIAENPYLAAAAGVLGYIVGYGLFTNAIMPFYERKDAER